MKIGEVAVAAGVNSSTVRFYEREGLIEQPDRESNGYRSYSPATAARVRFIRTAQASGIALRDVRDILEIRDSGHAPCSHVRQLLNDRLAAVTEQLNELTTLQQTLTGLLSDEASHAQLDGRFDGICPILER